MNIAGISSILVFFSNSIMGLLVLFRGTNKRIKKSWFLFCMAICIWAWGSYNFFTISSIKKAYFWWQIAIIGIMFIPVTYYNLIYVYCDLKKKIQRYLLISVYTLSCVFVILSAFYPQEVFGQLRWVFNQYYQLDWQSSKNPILLISYITLYWFLLSYAFFILIKSYRKSIGVLRNQLKYFIVASAIGWLGPTLMWLITFRIDIYPYSNFLIAIQPIFIGYAIVKYRLLDIKVALTRAGIFGIVYAVLLGVPLWMGYGLNHWQYALWIMLFSATAGPFIYLFLQRRADARMHAEEYHAHELLKQASQGMIHIHSINKLLRLIIHITTKTLQLDNASVFLAEPNSETFKLYAVRQKSKYHYLESLSENDPLIQKLALLREPLVYEEVRLESRDIKHKPDSSIHEIESQMHQLSAAVVIPAISRGRMLGFLSLGDKRSKRMYSPEDLSTLNALSHQAALAMENALFYEKEKIWLAEQSKRQALGEMAPGASHQFDNRLNTISAAADNLLDIIKTDLPNLSKEQLAEMVSSDLESIRAEVNKGKQITDAILQRSKVKLEFAPTDIVKVIENAINLTNLRRTRESLAGAKKPEFVFNHPASLPLLNLCEGPIQDVFENMFNNAIDAIVIKDKRKIEPDYSGKIAITILQRDKFIDVVVEDNGIGIQSENLRKLFTPLFTTKATSEKGVVGGSGLGLSVMQSFVEDHGGTIKVESEYTKWTKFAVSLPLDFKPRR